MTIHQTDQGIKNLNVDKAAILSSTSPDYAIKDLYEAIANKDYVRKAHYNIIIIIIIILQPSWTLHIQVMTYKEAEQFQWNPFDLTKVLGSRDYYTCVD